MGENLRFFSELYQPIDYSLSYFVAAGFEYSERNINAFNFAGDITASYRVSTTLFGLDIGRQFGNWGELRLEIRRAHGNVSVRIGNPGEGSNSFGRGSFYSAISYDTLDDYNFPLRGSNSDIIWMANLKELGSDISAHGLSINLMTAKTWDKNTFIPSISIQTALNSDDTPIQDTYPLGGFLNLCGAYGHAKASQKSIYFSLGKRF